MSKSSCQTLLAVCLFMLPWSTVTAQNDTLRVMWWNVENLFDTKHDSLKNDVEFLPESVRKWHYGRYKQKLSHIAKTIVGVGAWTPPAIIGLCEVENHQTMTDLTRHSPLSALGYRYIMTSSKDLRGIDIALLYQREVFKPLLWQAIALTGYKKASRPTRDILHVAGLLANGDTLDVILAHFPSRSGGAKLSEPYRLYAAQVAKSTIDSLYQIRQHANIVMMGDLNDYPYNASLKKILQVEVPNNKPKPHQLYHLLEKKAAAQHIGTYKYKGIWGLLDHLIVSGTLLNHTANTFTSESLAHIANLPFLFTTDKSYGGKCPFRTYYGMKYWGGYSDHLPIYTDLILQYKD